MGNRLSLPCSPCWLLYNESWKILLILTQVPTKAADQQMRSYFIIINTPEKSHSESIWKIGECNIILLKAQIIWKLYVCMELQGCVAVVVFRKWIETVHRKWTFFQLLTEKMLSLFHLWLMTESPNKQLYSSSWRGRSQEQKSQAASLSVPSCWSEHLILNFATCLEGIFQWQKKFLHLLSLLHYFNSDLQMQ